MILLSVATLPVLGDDHPDRLVQPGVPQGKMSAAEFSDSQIFPGTKRQYSVYVPAQYQPDQPANLMVFMDGASYAKADGAFRVLNLLVPGTSWQLVADNLGFADALCSDKEGNLYFCDMRAPAVYRISAASGMRAEVAKESVSGLELSPDGSLLYGCQGAKNRVVSINVANGEVKTVAEGVKPNDLAVTGDGFILITETAARKVTRINPQTGEVAAVDTGITKPNGIALSNDGGTLAVSDYGGEFAWMFRVNPGGTLDAKMPSMTLRLTIDNKGEFKFNEPPPYLTASLGDGMAVDKKGRYYVTSALGLQIFDPTGRACGVLPKPDGDQPLTTCILAGPDHSTLYIAHGSRIYSRKLRVE